MTLSALETGAEETEGETLTSPFGPPTSRPGPA